MKEDRWQIKVGDLLASEAGKKIETLKEIQISESLEGFSFSDPLLCEIELQKAGSGMVLGKFKISAKITGSCFRCLKKIEKEFNFKFNASFCEYEGDECDALIRYSIVDFKQIFYQELETHLPVKFLCSNRCKGLCERCGSDLNIKKCKCKK